MKSQIVWNPPSGSRMNSLSVYASSKHEQLPLPPLQNGVSLYSYLLLYSLSPFTLRDASVNDKQPSAPLTIGIPFYPLA
jgi:hypothetical protein